jgi:lambda repressor-like predicted transcriptional regulator
MIILAKIETIINTELLIKPDEIWLRRRQLKKRQQRKRLVKRSENSGFPQQIPLLFLK